MVLAVFVVAAFNAVSKIKGRVIQFRFSANSAAVNGSRARGIGLRLKLCFSYRLRSPAFPQSGTKKNQIVKESESRTQDGPVLLIGNQRNQRIVQDHRYDEDSNPFDLHWYDEHQQDLHIRIQSSDSQENPKINELGANTKGASEQREHYAKKDI